jgi:predicted class III extradiol MEMO1 family dioxygenase
MSLTIFLLEVINELKATKRFELLSLQGDEDEHSIEMHLPYVRKIFEGYVALL